MDISVLLSTYNRCDTLQKTLTAFCHLELAELEVNFVIIDNNCTDNTKEVINSFSNKLNITYLFEPTAGKSNALNKAIKEIELGEIVLFTDDDIIPDSNWLIEVANSCKEYPEISVFGGRIFPLWPDRQPQWLKSYDSTFYCWGYGQHDLGDQPVLYSKAKVPNEPFGGNFWVRKKIFSNGRLFNDKVGPTSQSNMRIMGQETYFLNKLKQDAYAMLYYPGSLVNHIIAPDQMTLQYLKKRAKTSGRTRAVSHTFKSLGLYRKLKLLWYILRYIYMTVAIIKRIPATLNINKSKRYEAIIRLYKRIGYDEIYLKHPEIILEFTNKSQEPK